MSQQKTIMLAVAGAGAVGAAVYAMQASDQSRNKARDKKDLGLEGAGIGRTGAAGGNERAIDPSQDKKVKTTAPRDKLPSGGVGGGPGAGGTSARAVELPTPGTSK